MVDLGHPRARTARPLLAVGDPERRHARLRTGRSPDARGTRRPCTARDRGGRCPRPRGGQVAERARGPPRRQRADDRDRRVVQHARLLEHDREVAAHAGERSLPAGRARPRLPERVRRAAARDTCVGAARLAADDHVHQRTGQQDRRPGEARPDAASRIPLPATTPGSACSPAAPGSRPAWRSRSSRCATRAPAPARSCS